MNSTNKNILLIIQNNSFPFDKRVYREAITLKEVGNSIFVICPRTKYDAESFVVEDGIEVRRYKDYESDGKISGFILEYLNSLIRIHLHLLNLIYRKNIDVVHVANPPDFFWPIAIISKILGIKFIYDQHDLAPEMSFIKYKSKIIKKVLLFNEKLTVKLSDAIIVANKTFKKRLKNQWGTNPEKCTVVYNGPTEDFIPIKNLELLKKYQSKKIILYVGLMTVNDNIEVILDVAKNLIKKENNLHFILVGDGDVRTKMEQLSKFYGISEHIEFVGLVNHKRVKEYLHIADVCIAPDLPNGLNEQLTLIKVLEYMKCSKSFVTFKLKETMDFAGDAGLYADDIEDFSKKILFLLKNKKVRSELGRIGNKIITEKYLWSNSAKQLLYLYHNIV